MQIERTEEEILEQAIKEWKQKGGKIQICEPGVRTEDIQIGQWGKRKKNKKIGAIKTDKFDKESK